MSPTKMNPINWYPSAVTFALGMTAATISLGTAAIQTQASEVWNERSPLAEPFPLAQLDSNTPNTPIQNGITQGGSTPGNTGSTESAPAPPPGSSVETIPNSSPNSSESSPAAPSLFDSSPSGLGTNQTLRQTPVEPNPVINNGVVPDGTPAPIQPLNNQPNNNVPSPRQNVPNRSIDTTPEPAAPNQNVLNQSVPNQNF